MTDAMSFFTLTMASSHSVVHVHLLLSLNLQEVGSLGVGQWPCLARTCGSNSSILTMNGPVERSLVLERERLHELSLEFRVACHYVSTVSDLLLKEFAFLPIYL